MGIRNDGGRSPLASSPLRSVTAPVSVGSGATVPVQAVGPVNPGGVEDRVERVVPGAGVAGVLPSVVSGAAARGGTGEDEGCSARGAAGAAPALEAEVPVGELGVLVGELGVLVGA